MGLPSLRAKWGTMPTPGAGYSLEQTSRRTTRRWRLRGWHGQTRLTVVALMGPVAWEETLKLRLGVPPTEEDENVRVAAARPKALPMADGQPSVSWRMPMPLKRRERILGTALSRHLAANQPMPGARPDFSTPARPTGLRSKWHSGARGLIVIRAPSRAGYCLAQTPSRVPSILTRPGQSCRIMKT